MPRLTNRPPKYACHKATNRALCYVNGKAIYLGTYNSPESKAEYRKIVAEWSNQAVPQDVPKPAQVAPQALSIAEALLQFKGFAEKTYGRHQENLREALRPLRQDFGHLPLSAFGPMQLRTLREKWIAAGLARHTINSKVLCIRRFFRWCVSYELVSAEVLAKISSLEPLMPGRGGIETTPKRPVPWSTVEETLPFLDPMHQAMVLFAWHCGARPSEVGKLTTGMIDQSGDIWVATMAKHKTAFYGCSRELLINRAAQMVITPWLMPDDPDSPIFSPRRADGKHPKRSTNLKPAGRTYQRSSFQIAIGKACRRGGIPEWSPGQLRHAFGTRVRESGGIEASQIAMGHSKPDTTLIYTGAAKERALDALRKMDRAESAE